jgi:hypothetical protein
MSNNETSQTTGDEAVGQGPSRRHWLGRAILLLWMFGIALADLALNGNVLWCNLAQYGLSPKIALNMWELNRALTGLLSKLG